ncbi:protein EMSY-LIKE 3-like isoform X2 [Amaranthus tricolor]|uniref:protein EMSY-LIKE 3-like isoform X1 n=1 Tax=Amaranthus tricolor TaxID=29722 RepID=UPI002587BC1B|nr:protein EMSY-LIKE 3-like isoform X1 [Amaranthus tricolor]XP_057539063.1 protein EMSY-LIKE 3-like isoform X2 [Amaranthus tricolor]
MDYDLSDSSGTDDDLPPPHQHRFARNARVTGNGRPAVAASTYPRMPNNDMETQIHIIEQEAYCAVLRAFKAQSDALTWEKESLITELRKELRVSVEEHRDSLSKVNSDDMIKKIRDWRQSNGHQQGMLSSFPPVHESVPSPTVSASRKKQKTGQSVSALSGGGALSSANGMHPSLQPSSSNLKRGPLPGSRGKKAKASMPYPSPAVAGRPQVNSHSASGTFGANEPDKAQKIDQLIGKRVWTRWPYDNSFYEALITDYKEGLHALVYDMNTEREAWEWVNLKEISPEDIRWDNEEPGLSHKGSRAGQGRGFKKSLARGGGAIGAGRGRGTLKGHPKKDSFMPQNGVGRREVGEIKLRNTDALIKEVENVFSANNPDSTEIEKAKKLLKEHEEALAQAIAVLQDASDGESDGGDHPFSQGKSMDREQGWRKRKYDEMGVEGRGRGTDGDKGRVSLERKQEA